MLKVIVGLGNPGLTYKYSRHNLGFMVVDQICAMQGIKKFKESTKFDARYFIDTTNQVAYLKPQTYMNNSGTSVAKFLKYYDVSPENVFVIHDEVDLPFLEIKKQNGHGSAGHNGVEDIIEKLGTKEFWRIRVGIGRSENKKQDTSDWVLANFSKKELSDISDLSKNIFQLITL